MRFTWKPCKSWLAWALILSWLLSACSASQAPGLPPGQPESQATHPPAHTPDAPPPAASPTPTPSLTPTATATLTLTPTPEPLRFAVIGDFGQGNQPEADVAALVKSWNPDFIITVGDNNYPLGAAETIDQNIGQFYHEYIFPYTGAYGPGADRLRLFPVLGNHDWDTQRGQPYLDYFVLPGNERYYDFVWGPVHFFALSSDSREPDGVGSGTLQGQWLQAGLAHSTAAWKVVYLHHSPYSSGISGGVDWARWPYKAWGASVVLAGHNHVYERLEVDGLTYFVNGLGGGPIYYFLDPVPGSILRFSADYGAMLVIADEQQMTFQFITRAGVVIDAYQLTR